METEAEEKNGKVLTPTQTKASECLDSRKSSTALDMLVKVNNKPKEKCK